MKGKESEEKIPGANPFEQIITSRENDVWGNCVISDHLLTLDWGTAILFMSGFHEEKHFIMGFQMDNT